MTQEIAGCDGQQCKKLIKIKDSSMKDNQISQVVRGIYMRNDQTSEVMGGGTGELLESRICRASNIPQQYQI